MKLQKNINYLRTIAMLCLIAACFSCTREEPRPTTLTVNAGENLSGTVGDEVVLDGSGTSDSEGLPITYSWALISTPAGSTASLTGANSISPRFTPDIAGDFIAELTASTQFEEKTDQVTISVAPRPNVIAISSNISTDTRWEKINSTPGEADYRITANIAVNAVLTIDPGVIIELAEGVIITINQDGRLNAVGSAAERIIFTGVEKRKGYWGKVFFNNSIGLQNRLEFVTFEYGGGARTADTFPFALVYLRAQFSSSGSTASFVNCIFRESAGIGLGTDATATTDINDFSNNLFTNIDQEAISTALRIARKIDAGSTFTGNGLNGARLRSNTMAVPVSLPGLDYIISSSNMIVREKLTIAAGAKFTVQEGIDITIETDGIFEAIGTETDPIIFEGAQNTPGYWGGIYFTNSRSVDNKMSYVQVSDGGNRLHDNFRFNVAVAGTFSSEFSELRIDHCTFSNSSGFGLITNRAQTSLPSFNNNNFIGNQEGAIRLSSIEHVRFIDSATDLGDVNNFVLVSAGIATSNGIWKKLNGSAYYIFNSTVVVEGKITIEPGAEFRFGENTMINIRDDASLTAEGTSELPIKFTSNRNDDIVFWNGIYFNNSNSVDNIMRHCIVENAGRNAVQANTGQALVTVGGNFSSNVSQLVIENCTLRNSDGYGISVRNNSSINGDAATSNTFVNITNSNVNLP
jgi:hypothetical protein